MANPLDLLICMSIICLGSCWFAEIGRERHFDVWKPLNKDYDDDFLSDNPYMEDFLPAKVFST